LFYRAADKQSRIQYVGKPSATSKRWRRSLAYRLDEYFGQQLELGQAVHQLAVVLDALVGLYKQRVDFDTCLVLLGLTAVTSNKAVSIHSFIHSSIHPSIHSFTDTIERTPRSNKPAS